MIVPRYPHLPFGHPLPEGEESSSALLLQFAREPLANRPRLAERGDVILCRRARRFLREISKSLSENLEPLIPGPLPQGRGEYSDRL